MSASHLSSQLKRTGEILRNGAGDRILDYGRKFRSFNELYPNLLHRLMNSNLDPKSAAKMALEFFGSTKVKFAAVDGTEYAQKVFDLIIFFGGAYVATGSIDFEGHPSVTYEDDFVEKGRGISSCVPVYVNEILELDQQFFDVEEPGEISLSKGVNEQSIVDNSYIAEAIMTFSEFYLALKLVLDPHQNIKIILLDRSISSSYSSLLYDTGRRGHWRKASALLGYEVDNHSLDEADLDLGRHHLVNEQLSLPPAREDFLRHSLVFALTSRGPLDFEGLCGVLKISEPDFKERTKKILERTIKNDGYIVEHNGSYSVAEEYRDAWNRIRRMTLMLGDQMFLGGGSSAELMKIDNKGEKRWLTTLDIAFLTLFALNMLIEECWRRRILLVGITKDTASRDFISRLLPVMITEGEWPLTLEPSQFKNLPATDRMLLQSISLNHHEKVRVPWGLVEFDGAFQTAIPDRKNRRGYVSGAIQERISLERTFLRSYVQLSQARFDPKLRSNVLLIDRLVYPEFDNKAQNKLHFKHDYGGATESVDVFVFKGGSQQNPLQNLVLVMLDLMKADNIPEVFGHNKPLFIADKVAKWFGGQVGKMIESTGHWVLNNRELRDFSFYMSTFRERRAEIEQARR